MSISREIKVATIQIADASTTLENKVTIALPSQTSLTVKKWNYGKEICQKPVCILIFLFLSSLWRTKLTALKALPCKTVLDMR